MTNFFQTKINNLLHKICNEGVTVDEKLLDEFANNLKKSIRRQFSGHKEYPFKLRMSNIGTDIRQLHLQKIHGRTAPSPDSKLRMLHGDCAEALWMFIIKTAGIKVLEEQTPVTLEVENEKVEGTLDLVALNEETGEPEVVDIKTTSMIRKFEDVHTLANDDPFGYIAQLFGYAEATKTRAGGWWVFDKVGGAFKVLDIGHNFYGELRDRAMDKIKSTILHFKNNEPIPECEGVEEELWRGKKTGNKILGDKCKFCNYKESCHPGVSYQPCKFSEAKSKPMKWYLPK